MKKVVILIVSIILVCTLLVACGQEVVNNQENNINETNDKNETNDSNEIINDAENNNGYVSTAEYAPPAYIPEGYDMSERYDIEIMLIGSAKPEAEKYTFAKDEIEKVLNIDLSFGVFNSKNADMDLVAAADIMPECGWVYMGTSSSAHQGYMDGLTRTIPMEYVKEYAPWYWQSMLEDKSFHTANLAKGTDDEYYTLYAARYGGMIELGSGVVLHLDWLENLGYEPLGNIEPVYEDKIYITDVAYKWSEFNDLIYEFTFSDPDVNGENDTYGYNAAGLNLTGQLYGGTIFSLLGASPNYCSDDKGWAVPIMYSKQNIEFFSILGEWQNLGVIPQGFATKGDSDAQKLWASGKVGTTGFFLKTMWSNFTEADLKEGMFWNQQIPMNIYSNNIEAKIILTPPLLDDEGNGGKGVPYERAIRSLSAGYFFVRSDVDDEKLKRIMLLMDYVSMNPNAYLFTAVGVEDIHWIRDEKYHTTYTVEDQSHLPDNMVWKAFDFFATPCFPNTKYIGFTKEPPWLGGYYIDKEQEANATFKQYANKDKTKGIEAVPGGTTGGFSSTYQKENWPTLSYPYIDEASLFGITDDLEFTQMASMRSYMKAYKEARTSLLSNKGDFQTIWDNLIAVLNANGYQEYLSVINNKAYLRDELFYEGKIITPAEKFPLN